MTRAADAPRQTVASLGVFALAMAVQWWWSSPRRSASPAFRPARRIGSCLSTAHPMWLWALLFTIIAVPLLAGALFNDRHLAGIGCILGAPLMFAYGVLSGWVAVSTSSAAFTGVITFSFLSVWHVLDAATLLGSRRRRWG